MSRKSVPKCKPNHTKKLAVSEKFPSFVSAVSDCSCETKSVNLQAEDCENTLHEFIESFSHLGQIGDAQRIAVQCLEYVNVVLFNIEWLVRERNRAIDESLELNKSVDQLDRQNSTLIDEIEQIQKTNHQSKQENSLILKNYYLEEDSLRSIQLEINSHRMFIENQHATTKEQLRKIASLSVQVEKDVVEKEVHWEKMNFYLKQRVDQLYQDNETLNANYQLINDTLCNDDVQLDVDVLEAYYEAEMLMMKRDHESFISDLNKSNYKLWNEKFFIRSRLEEESKKCEYYQRCVEVLQIENTNSREKIFYLNKQVEDLLNVICSQIAKRCSQMVTSSIFHQFDVIK